MKHDGPPSRLMTIDLVDVNELARRLGISRHTIYSWVSQRRIPYLKVGRLLRFEPTAVDAWLRGCEVNSFDGRTVARSAEQPAEPKTIGRPRLSHHQESSQ